MLLSSLLRAFAAVCLASGPLFIAGHADAAPQSQSYPESGTTAPNPQDEANNDKPTGTGEETTGDPVEISTGAFAFSKKVLELPGRGRDLSLTLSYVSNAQGIETQTGARWTHDLEERLMIQYTWGAPVEPYEGPLDLGPYLPEEEDPEWVPRPLFIEVYHFHDLRVDYYSRNATDAGDWIPTSGQFTKLHSTNQQSGPYSLPRSFTLRHPNGTIVEFPVDLWEGGCGTYTIRAKSITDRQGNQINLNYESKAKTPTCATYSEGSYFWQLATAVDTLGRTVQFEYDTVGWLNLIRDHTGREVALEHDSNGNITAISAPQVAVFPPDTSVLPYTAKTKFGYSAYNALYPHTKHNIEWVAAPIEVAANSTAPQPYVVNTWDDTGERVVSQVVGGDNGTVPAGGVHAFLYEQSNPPASQGWFDYAARTLTVSPDGHAELHYFDASWRPRLVYRFTGGLDPVAVSGGAYSIDDLVVVDPSLPSTAAALGSVSGVTLPAVGSDTAIGCLWTRTDYTSTNLPSFEATQDSRTEYYYDSSNPDRFQQGNLLVLKQLQTPGIRAITRAYAYEPLYNQLRVEYDPRAFGSYSPPNGGTHTPERYAKTYSFDYQALSATTGPVGDLADYWDIDLTQSSVTSFLGGTGYGLTVNAIAFAGGSTGSIAGNVVSEDRPVRVYLDPQANPPTFQSITESTTTTYNSYGLPTSLVDPGGFSTTFTYYAAGAVAPQPGTSASASNGGYLASMTRAVNLSATTVVTEYFGYDAVGRQTVHRNARGYDTTGVYDEMDRLVQATDALGTDRGTLYDANGNATEELAEYSTPSMASSTGLPNGTYTYPRSIRTTMEYDLLDKLVARTVQNGPSDAPSVVQYRYTRGGARVLTLFPLWSIDDKNVEASVLDEFGRTHTSTMGGVSAQFAGLFANQDIPGLSSIPVDVTDVTTTKKSFYAGSRKVIDRDADGFDTEYEYDGYNRLIRTTTPLGHYTDFAYDQASQKTQIKSYEAGGVLLAKTDTKYDERRQPFEVLREHKSTTGIAIGDGSASTRSGYDVRGLCVRLVDDASEATTTAYDGLGRAERVDDAEGNYSLLTYDPNGNLIYSEVHEPETGAPSTVHVRKNWAFHDALDRVTTTVDHLGHAVRTRYDTLGRVVFTSDARTTTANVNVALNSLDSSTRPQHSGLSTSFMVNSHGNTTWFTYDDAGYQLSTTRHMRVSGLGGNSLLSGGGGTIVTARAYNLNGHLMSETDDKGNTTSYGYDSLNRRNTITYANTTAWSCTYYLRGLMKASTDPNGTVVDYTYDDDGRPVIETVAPGNPDVIGETTAQFQYDGLARLTSAQNTVSTVLREYDTLSQLAVETLNSHRTEIRRAGNGFLQGFTYPSTRTLNHIRDGIGRLRAIHEQGGSTAIAELEYRGVAAIKARDYFNGTSTAYVYDGILRPLDVTHSLGSTVLTRRTSIWDRQGNRAMREDPRQSPVRTFTYTYDSAARMVQSGRVGGGQSAETITYTLDDVGNRTTVTGGPDAGTYTLNTSDSPVNLYTSTPAGASTYDDNATLQSRGGGAATTRYDYRDRLIEYVDVTNGRTHLFEYDALGRRVKKTTNVGALQEREVRYFYDGGWNAIEEHDGNGDVIATLVYEDGLDALVEVQRDDTGAGGFVAMAYHSDDQLNVLAVSNGSGAVIEEYEYRDFGQVVDPSTMLPITGSAVGNSVTFSGREVDWETGLYNFRRRYLDPHAGRFQSRDPIGTFGDSANLGNGQSYCGNNPWSRRDPIGLDANAVDSATCGDLRTSTSDPVGVKGDCDHHGSAQATDKSGERVSSSAYWTARNAARHAAQASHDRSRAAITRIRDKLASNNEQRDRLSRYDITQLFGGSDTDASFRTTKGENGEIVAHFTGNDGVTSSQSFDCTSLSGMQAFETYLGNLEGNIDASSGILQTCNTINKGNEALAVVGIAALGAGAVSAISFGSLAMASGAPIVVGARALEHATARHAAGTVPLASKFLSGESIRGLVEASQSVAPVAQNSGGNFARVVDAGRLVGSALVRLPPGVQGPINSIPTSVYTVITNANNHLVTAFPGLPLR